MSLWLTKWKFDMYVSLRKSNLAREKIHKQRQRCCHAKANKSRKSDLKWRYYLSHRHTDHRKSKSPRQREFKNPYLEPKRKKSKQLDVFMTCERETYSYQSTHSSNQISIEAWLRAEPLAKQMNKQKNLMKYYVLECRQITVPRTLALPVKYKTDSLFAQSPVYTFSVKLCSALK